MSRVGLPLRTWVFCYLPLNSLAWPHRYRVLMHRVIRCQRVLALLVPLQPDVNGRSRLISSPSYHRPAPGLPSILGFLVVVDEDPFDGIVLVGEAERGRGQHCSVLVNPDT